MAASTSTPFQIVPYESEILLLGEDIPLGFIVHVRADVLALEIGDVTNAAPDSSLYTQTGLRARTSSGKRRTGLVTRSLTITRLIGTAGALSRIYRRVPLLTSGIAQNLRTGGPPLITYQGETDWVVVGLARETSSTWSRSASP